MYIVAVSSVCPSSEQTPKSDDGFINRGTCVISKWRDYNSHFTVFKKQKKQNNSGSLGNT